MPRNKKKYERNKYCKKQILLICLAFILAFSFAFTLGRYVTDNAKDFFTRTKKFYFFSDQMSENTSVFQINDWTGVDPYMFTIGMNSRKNNKEVALDDIEYTIKYDCTPNAICQVSKTKGIIPANSNSDLFYITITPNTQLDVGDEVVVNVEATSISDYKKTIKGKFRLVVGKEQLSYEIDDRKNSPYITLNITNTISYYTAKEAFGTFQKGERIDVDTYKTLSQNEQSKCYSRIVDISFDPNKILLDMTNENYNKSTNVINKIINGKNFINGFKIEMEPISSMKIRFYKVDVTKDYTYPNASNQSIVTVNSR